MPSVSILHDRVEVGSRADCDTARPGGTARTAASSSHSSQATAATICWARMSSGASGISMRSSSPRADGADQGQAFEQLVAREREQPPLGNRAERVARAADALQERGDRPRRADLADQVDVADVDAHLERRGGDDRLELARLEPLLGVEADLARQAAVMAGDRVFAEQLGQAMGHPLGQPPRVDEDQRAAVRLRSAPPAARRLRPTARSSRRPPARSAALRCARSSSRTWPTSMIAGSSGVAGFVGLRIWPTADQKRARSRRSASAWPTGRSASAAARTARPAVPATAPGASRACRGPGRESHRRSPSSPSAASRGSWPR